MLPAYSWLAFCGLPCISAYYISPAVPPEAIPDCGNSIEEARRLNCSFDYFSYGYYPPACYDAFQIDYYMDLYDIFNWTTKDGTPVPISSIWNGDHEVVYSDSHEGIGFHELHCTFEWQRLVRAIAPGWRLDIKLSRFEHSFHCTGRLLDRERPTYAFTTDAHMLYSRCGLTFEEMYAHGGYEVGAVAR